MARGSGNAVAASSSEEPPSRSPEVNRLEFRVYAGPRVKPPDGEKPNALVGGRKSRVTAEFLLINRFITLPNCCLSF